MPPTRRDPEIAHPPANLDLAQMAAALERTFAATQRDLPWRRHYDPYQIWVSEVMLQQTRMEVVVPYFHRFIERFPDVASLAAAEVDEVLESWSGLGYYRRARMLHDGAQFVMQQWGGVIPEQIDRLRSIPGVGRYTAGAIASIAFDRREAIADGNIIRLLSRVGAFEGIAGSTSLTEDVWELAAGLVAVAGSPRNLNQALMEHGALVCRPENPRCASCVIADQCRGRSIAESLPRRAPKRARVAVTIPLFVMRDQAGRVLLEQHHGRRMNGMFHLPHGNDELIADSSDRFSRGESLGSFRHTVTFRDITFELVEASAGDLVGEGADAVWVDPRAPLSLPHPSYVRKALRLLTTEMEGGLIARPLGRINDHPRS